MPSKAKSSPAGKKPKTNRQASVIGLKESETFASPQGQRLIYHVTNKSTGSEGLASCIVVMPPGGQAKTHVHNKHELIVVCVEGHAATLVGPEMKPLYHGPGEFLFVPPGVEHTAVNLSPDERLVVFEVRTDKHFNEDVELLPHLEEQASKVIAKMRAKLAAGKLEIPKHWDLGSRVYRFSEV